MAAGGWVCWRGLVLPLLEDSSSAGLGSWVEVVPVSFGLGHAVGTSHPCGQDSWWRHLHLQEGYLKRIRRLCPT